MSAVLYALLILGGMGLIFGCGLAIASKVFEVKKDEREGLVRECLPGANCGACGNPGCDGYAAAIVNDGAAFDLCPVGGPKVASQISMIMTGSGDVPEREKMVAVIRCRGDRTASAEKFNYDGITDCRSAMVLFKGPKACPYGCLGMGSCKAACPFGAIYIRDGLAHIDAELCKGCGKCVSVCPRNVIALVPAKQPVKLVCQTREAGKDVRALCAVGCIGCGVCEKSCPNNAITMVDNMPVIDTAKCTGCYVCVEKCPTDALRGDLSLRRHAEIDPQKCKGCTLCKRNCPFEAIEGAPKLLHHVNESMCKGCGICVEKCRFGAITLTR